MAINLYNTVLADAGGSGGIQRTPNISPPVQTTRPVATKTVAQTPVTATRTTAMTGTSTASLPPSVQRQIAAAQPVAKAPAVSGAVQETQQMQTRLINETIQKPTVVQGMTGTSTASLPASVQQAIAREEQARRDRERDAADAALLKAMSATATPPAGTFDFKKESEKDTSQVLLQASRTGGDKFWFNGVQYNTRQEAEEAQRNAKIVGMGDMRLPAQMTEEEFLDSVKGPQPIIQAIDDAPGSSMSDGLKQRLEGSDVGIDERQGDVIETPTVVDEEEIDLDEEEIDLDEEESDEEPAQRIESQASSIVNEMSLASNQFMYSWDERALAEAEAQYGVDVAQAVRNAVEARNQLAVQRAEALNTFYGGQYASASKIEKFGWTGGAATDEKMRMAFLNATLNSQMYNQKEMVLAGYDSELAIAREFAQLNLTKLANEKYQQAQENAISMAEITGRYMSPEARDILSNYFAAEANPNDPRSASIIGGVNQWLASQGITPEEFVQMKDYFKSYILYGSTVGARQWDKAVETAELKTVHKTFNGYNYSLEEWDNFVTTLEASGVKWNESTGNFTRDGEVVTVDEDGEGVEEPGSIIQKTATVNDVAGLLDGFNKDKRLVQTKFTVSELEKIMSLDPTTLKPIYGSSGNVDRDYSVNFGPGARFDIITGYELPKGTTNKAINTITKAQYDYLVQRWWSK